MVRTSKLILILSFWVQLAQAQERVFVDLGFIPKTITVSTPFQPMIYYDGYVFVATSDGVWKNKISTKEWTPSGLEGKEITALYQHPEDAKKFYAGVMSESLASEPTLYISSDAGATWVAAGDPIFSEFEGEYEPYYCFAVRPGNPNHIYANMKGGAMIAVSTDGGDTWQRMNYLDDAYIGYTSCIAFIPGASDYIYQGSENPLDDAWLAHYTIDSEDPVLLGDFTKIIDMEDWDNRRPNQMKTYNYTGNNIYVGNEGALSKITDGALTYIYYVPTISDEPYTYVSGIWVNPSNTNHILFGGVTNGGGPDLLLFETQDEGINNIRIDEDFGFTQPKVCDIISAEQYAAILIEEYYGSSAPSKVKVVLYDYDNPSSTPHNVPLGNQIQVYPNPTTNIVNIVYAPELDNKELTVSVFDNMGRFVLQYEPGIKVQSIDISNLASGVYYILFESKDKISTKKIAKE